MDIANLMKGDCSYDKGNVDSASNRSVDICSIASCRAAGVSRIEYRENGTLIQVPMIEGNLLWIRSSWGLDGKSRYAYSVNGQEFIPFGGIYQLP